MTKQEAIKNHRKMWNWIADQIEERKEIVTKVDYFDYIGTPAEERPLANCFCCEYAMEEYQKSPNLAKCINCPIKWPVETNGEAFCLSNGCSYQKFLAFNYKRAAELARQIANLPEREEFKVVTICGSNKFREEQMVVYRELTLMNCLVFLPAYDGYLNGMKGDQLQRLHFEKIKLSDAIYVVTNNGYWGSSTQEEIIYAKSLGKNVMIRDFGTSTTGTYKDFDDEE